MAAEYGCVSGQNAGRNHSDTGQAGGLVAPVLLLIVLVWSIIEYRMLAQYSNLHISQHPVFEAEIQDPCISQSPTNVA